MVKIGVLNVGSSSQKSKLYELAEELPEQPPRLLWEAKADWAEHRGETNLKITTAHGETVAEKPPTDSRREVDAIVFTGGVGEHDASLRASVCEAFAFLGLQLDSEKNAQSPADRDIAAADSSVRVLLIQTQEEWSIAKECWRLATSHSSQNG